MAARGAYALGAEHMLSAQSIDIVAAVWYNKRGFSDLDDGEVRLWDNAVSTSAAF